MPIDYLPILIFVFAATVMAVVSLGLPHLLGPRKPSKVKLAVVESGKINYGDAQQRIPVHYYVIAMLFIVFDIEVLFFYPWAVLFWDLKWFGLIQVGIFLILLLESYIYVWKKGVFDEWI